MYNVMIKMPQGKYSPATYRFVTEVKDGVTVHKSFDDLTVLDKYVEGLLNGNLSREDVLVVKPIDYTVETDIDEFAPLPPEEADFATDDDIKDLI